jgi:hypothetical protein
MTRCTRVSEVTSAHSRIFRLTNASASAKACHLNGYPHIALLDKNGNPIPFVYRDTGDQMVTASLPTPVALLPGHTVYLMFDKYRCDVGDITRVNSVVITPPGNTVALHLPPGPRRDHFSYRGPGDPGSVVFVSPVEPTARALFAH